jgi:hypothetical protein
MRRSHDRVEWRTMILEVFKGSATTVLIYTLVHVHNTQYDLTLEQQANVAMKSSYRLRHEITKGV